MPDFGVGTTFKGIDKLTPVFKKMGRGIASFTKTGVKAMDRLNGAINRGAKKLLGPIQQFLPALGVAGFLKLANDGIELASALTEVQNVVDTTFGKQGASKINAWADTALEKWGLSELQAKQFSGTIGAMAKGAGVSQDKLYGMSTGLSELAGDFASFYNLPIEEAFNKIRAGLSGETEPLKQIGKDMSVAGLEAFRLAQGIQKSVKNMTMAEKYQLRFAYLMSQSKDQMGDFNKTLATSYANQKRVLGVQFDQFLARIMTKILPRLTELFKNLNNVLANIDTESISIWLDRIVTALPYIAGGFVAWKVAILAVWTVQKIMMAAGWIKYLFMMSGAIKKIIFSTKVWTAVQKVLNFVMKMNPIGLIITAVAALVAGIIYLVKNWEDVKKSLSDNAWGQGLLFIIDVVKAGIEDLTQKFEMLKKVFEGDFSGAMRSRAQSGMLGEITKQEAAKKNMSVEQYLDEKFGKEAPNKTEVQARKIQFDGNININNAPSGTTVSGKTRGARPINMALVGAQ